MITTFLASKFESTLSKRRISSGSLSSQRFPALWLSFRLAFIFAFACAILALSLPVLGANAVGSIESGIVSIRGYNLAEFSGYGMAIILAPFLLLNVQYSGLSRKRALVAVLTVCAGYAVCYILSCMAGRDWLMALESIEPISRYNLIHGRGEWVIPSLFLVQAAFTSITAIFAEDEAKGGCSDADNQ